jgi:hypothetical protein
MKPCISSRDLALFFLRERFPERQQKQTNARRHLALAAIRQRLDQLGSLGLFCKIVCHILQSTTLGLG